MCTAENVISGILVALTAFIMGGAVTIMLSTIYNDYKENKEKD